MLTEYIIEHKRIAYRSESTLGQVFLPVPFSAKPFCYTLEDTVRAFGIKVMKDTAIPAHRYKVAVRISPKYGEVLVLYDRIEIRNGIDVYIVDNNGIYFEMILVHGGNDIDDTEGCILTCKNLVQTKDNEEFRIQGACHKELLNIIKPYIESGVSVYWNITNHPQKG